MIDEVPSLVALEDEFAAYERRVNEFTGMNALDPSLVTVAAGLQKAHTSLSEKTAELLKRYQAQYAALQEALK